MSRKLLAILAAALLFGALAVTTPVAAEEEIAAPEAMTPVDDEFIEPMTLDEAVVLLEARDAPEADPLGEAFTDPASADIVDVVENHLPTVMHRGFADLQAGQITRPAQRTLGVFAGVVLMLFVLGRIARGRGDVAIVIDYPSELRGTFSVKLSKSSTGAKRSAAIITPSDAERARRNAPSSSRTERHAVSRETLFAEVRVRRYFVTVDGFLQTAESDDVLATHFEEQEVHPKRGQTERLSFDFRPRACPVEVRVMWDKRPVQEAQIARFGAPGSMRFARGPVQYTLDRGTHRLVAGSSDRVAVVEIEIDSFQPRQLAIDLADREHLLFTGCPQAVEPYLSGDIPAAARALERDGQNEAAQKLLGQFHEERGQRERAAVHYEHAGQLAHAAELYQACTQFEKAAELYERVGEDELAGEMFRSAGKLLRAGDAYSRADSYASAVECFKKAGDVTRWIEALAKKGEHYEAARVAMEQKDRTRAIQYLNQVTTNAADYPDAAVMLAEAYQAEGHHDLAARKLEELMATRDEDSVPNAALDRLAQILEEGGAYDRALRLLERLRMRDATYPNVATRVELLRKRISKDETRPDAGTNTAVAQAFGDEFRYEIVEEIGRGGMGVVFRARDRRLGREVALKRLPDNIRNHPKAIELFLREARAAAALNHPNIVTLYDAGQEDGAYYITMELLVGLPLQKILASQGHLKSAHVAKLGGQVATGLEYAHEQGVVHRDIKTANLFFTQKKVMKIMDFGLAKMVEEVRRSTTVIGGTPYYMAPEQSAGEQVDHRADLYALGVTFYELLTGSVPFSEGDVAFHHRHTQPIDPRAKIEGISDPLAELVLELLAKDPAHRIRSAGEVVRRLTEIARAL